MKIFFEVVKEMRRIKVLDKVDMCRSIKILRMSRPLLDSERKMTGYLGTVTDITSRKTLQISLERGAL